MTSLGKIVSFTRSLLKTRLRNGSGVARHGAARNKLLNAPLFFSGGLDRLLLLSVSVKIMTLFLIWVHQLGGKSRGKCCGTDLRSRITERRKQNSRSFGAVPMLNNNIKKTKPSFDKKKNCRRILFFLFSSPVGWVGKGTSQL